MLTISTSLLCMSTINAEDLKDIKIEEEDKLSFFEFCMYFHECFSVEHFYSGVQPKMALLFDAGWGRGSPLP